MQYFKKVTLYSGLTLNEIKFLEHPTSEKS